MSEAVIKCENVYKIFGTNAQKMLQEANGNVDAKTFQENGCIVGVNDASFEVSKGEMLVVMGLSGSGKSTLLRCISRLTDATGGKIFIEGQDLLKLNNKELINLRRNKMGMVFQSFALLPHKTVLENIAFPLQIKGIKTEDSINKGIGLLSFYSLGLAIPFVLSGYLIQKFMIFSKNLKTKMNIINKIGGSLLLITGVLMITNQLQALGYYLLEYIPFMQNLG